jgi:hypothetical protein
VEFGQQVLCRQQFRRSLRLLQLTIPKSSSTEAASNQSRTLRISRGGTDDKVIQQYGMFPLSRFTLRCETDVSAMLLDAAALGLSVGLGMGGVEEA